MFMDVSTERSIPRETAGDKQPGKAGHPLRGKKRIVLLVFCILILAVLLIGGCVLLSGGPRSGKYPGTVVLPDGAGVPFEVMLKADGRILTGDALSLPFAGELKLDRPLALQKRDFGQTVQTTAEGTAVTLIVENRQPQSEMADFEADRQAEHLYLAEGGDSFYHTAAFSCDQKVNGQPARYFAVSAEAGLYGCAPCPRCLPEDGGLVDQASVQPELVPESEVSPAPDELVSVQPAAASSQTASSSQPAASRPAGDSGKVKDDGLCKTEGCSSAQSDYCAEHTCKGLLCHSPALPGFDYCSAHKCGLPDCGEIRTGSKYCELHSCVIRNCPYPTTRGLLTLCKEHTCHYPDCSNQATALGGYCQKHLCRYYGCESGQIPQNYGFCQNHRCAVPGCSQSIYNGTPYCEDHQPA